MPELRTPERNSSLDVRTNTTEDCAHQTRLAFTSVQYSSRTSENFVSWHQSSKTAVLTQNLWRHTNIKTAGSGLFIYKPHTGVCFYFSQQGDVPNYELMWCGLGICPTEQYLSTASIKGTTWRGWYISAWRKMTFSHPTNAKNNEQMFHKIYPALGKFKKTTAVGLLFLMV